MGPKIELFQKTVGGEEKNVGWGICWPAGPFFIDKS